MFHYLDNAATTPVRPEAARRVGQPLLSVRPGQAGGRPGEGLAGGPGRGAGL